MTTLTHCEPATDTTTTPEDDEVATTPDTDTSTSATDDEAPTTPATDTSRSDEGATKQARHQSLHH